MYPKFALFPRLPGMESIPSQALSGTRLQLFPCVEAGTRRASPAPDPPPNRTRVSETSLYGVPIVYLVIDGQERLCLAQISNTLLKNYSYNEIHNRRVALGITCVQCTPVQLEILRRAGAMPSPPGVRHDHQTRGERLCKSFLGAHNPPKLRKISHLTSPTMCAWGSRGSIYTR
ncbi:SKI family transcriptional corepressor 1 -B [Merluccius polli]|uniref:SKI family transcriptional corepressor 1 -B n=1 Tax=Merluccius polli TaxID=89951 RepID=A0AA47MJV2_MERPO|nr:SKI family transcriptional corepressor 1 -B [Merluccius polli]